MAPNPVTVVRQAARAEKAVEQTRAEAEQAWRTAWWATTDALAAVPATPREQLTEAVDAAIRILGQTKAYVSRRRSCGQHFVVLEDNERSVLIPRFAVAAVNGKVDPGLAADLIRQAEHEDVGLREFNQLLTGRSWTKAPENMTPDERKQVAQTEIRKRPDEVLEPDDVREAAEGASVRIRAGRAPAYRPEHVEHVRNEHERRTSAAYGLPEVPTQHLNAAAGEIGSALIARDIHGVEDEDAWNAALDKIQTALDLARADSGAWSAADRRRAADLGIRL